MAQTFPDIDGDTIARDSVTLFEQRDEALRTHFSGATAPAEASLYQTYFNTSDGKMYICTNATGPVFTELFAYLMQNLPGLVTSANLRDSAALSVIGRAANSTGVPSDVAAANDGEVLRRAGTALGFGQLATAGITDDVVTNAKLANMAAGTVKANVTGGAADPADVTLADLKSGLSLSNVDNTSDATKNAAAAALTNKTIDGDLNTIQDVAIASMKFSATARLAARFTASGGAGEEATLGTGLSFSAGALTVNVATALGYTPVNKAGDTMTGNLLFSADATYDIGANGATRPRNVYVATAVVAGYIQPSIEVVWANRGRMSFPTTDGVALLTNNAVTDFGRLQFGGTTSSFPALKRSGAGLQVRLADDSTLAGLETRTLDAYGKIRSLLGTITADTPSLDASQTWNNVAVTFTGLKFNATDTTSASASLLMDLQVGGASKFSVRKDGKIVNAGSILQSTGVAIGQNGAGHLSVRMEGTYSWSSTTDSQGTADLFLLRDAAGVLAQRNSTNAQAFRLYNTYTDASNYERGFLNWSGNVFQIGTGAAGTGTNRTLEFVTAGSSRWQINGSGHLLAATDNTYDIGASGATRPRSIYVGTDVILPAGGNYVRWENRARLNSPADSIVTLLNNAASDFDRLQFGGTTSSFPALKRSAAILQARLADDSAHTGLEVVDDAYAAGWNGSLLVPTKNAVYDKIASLAQADIAGLTAASSPQFTAVEIGHATDTTLARASAGVVSIEGVNILTAAIASVRAGLDTMGTTRGSIMYRGASGWTTLTPGASGEVLKANGAGADPSWGTDATGGGGVSDGDKGDITVSSTGAVWTIDNDAVTYAKMQNVSATDRLLGRDTAAAGDVEELTVGGGIEFTGAGGIQRSALTGDVTASAGSAATTIANNVVSLAKMATMATDSILGRASASTGNVEVLSALPFAFTGDVTRAADSNAQTIANAAVTLAKMANLAQDQFIGRVTGSTGVPETATITAAARSVLDDTTVGAMCDTLTALKQGTTEFNLAAPAWKPRASNGCSALTSFESSTYKVNYECLDFDPSADEFAQFQFIVPKGCSISSFACQFIWSSTATGSVVWGAQAVAVSDDDAYDAAFGTAATVTDGVTATGDVMISGFTSAITVAGSPAAGDIVTIQIYRDADNGSDTCAADARLIGVRMQWTLSAGNDA